MAHRAPFTRELTRMLGTKENFMIPDKQIIEASKSKTLLLIALGIAFVVMGVWLFTLDSAVIESMRRFNNPILIHGIGIVCIIFFGLATVAAIWRFFSSKPGLELSSDGINIFAMGPGTFIPWSDVSGFSVYEIHKQKMLVINLHDPNKYIETGGKIRRQIAKANYNLCGSPFAISSNALKINFRSLCELCERYILEYGKGT